MESIIEFCISTKIIFTGHYTKFTVQMLIITGFQNNRDQNSTDKWSIHGTKYHKAKQLQSSRHDTSWECKIDAREVCHSKFNPILSKETRGQKCPYLIDNILNYLLKRLLQFIYVLPAMFCWVESKAAER